jgi:hypothetical protein
MGIAMRFTVAGIALLFSVTLGMAAGTERDFKAALASAEAAEKDAGALKNQWTTTEQVLAVARKAAAAGDFENAIMAATQAEALAKASIAQAKEQQESWRAGVIH